MLLGCAVKNHSARPATHLPGMNHHESPPPLMNLASGKVAQALKRPAAEEAAAAAPCQAPALWMDEPHYPREGAGNWVWAAVQPLLGGVRYLLVPGTLCDPGLHWPLARRPRTMRAGRLIGTRAWRGLVSSARFRADALTVRDQFLARGFSV